MHVNKVKNLNQVKWNILGGNYESKQSLQMYVI